LSVLTDRRHGAPVRFALQPRTRVPSSKCCAGPSCALRSYSCRRLSSGYPPADPICGNLVTRTQGHGASSARSATLARKRAALIRPPRRPGTTQKLAQARARRRPAPPPQLSATLQAKSMREGQPRSPSSMLNDRQAHAARLAMSTPDRHRRRLDPCLANAAKARFDEHRAIWKTIGESYELMAVLARLCLAQANRLRTLRRPNKDPMWTPLVTAPLSQAPS
jgi:hypothetical protein